MRFEEGLEITQRQRKMAEPNPTFTKLLQQFEKSDTLEDLRLKLNTCQFPCPIDVIL